MGSGISGFKVFHYSQREKKEILTAKAAKGSGKARRDFESVKSGHRETTVALDVSSLSRENRFAEVIYVALFIRAACGCISLPDPPPAAASVGLYPAHGLATLLWRLWITAADVGPSCCSCGDGRNSFEIRLRLSHSMGLIRDVGVVRGDCIARRQAGGAFKDDLGAVFGAGQFSLIFSCQ